MTVILFVAPTAQAAELLAGPLVGHTTETSSRIWVETDEPADVRIDYWLQPRLQYDDAVREPVRRGSATGRTTTDAPHTATIDLRDLPSGWMVQYTVVVNGRPMRALSPQIFSLQPSLPKAPATAPPTFSVAFGSCNFPARIPIQPIWGQVIRRRPAAFVFLGDNNYLPNQAESFALPRDQLRVFIGESHRMLRNVGGLRDLMASTPCHAIWDDHDFGPNNSNRTFAVKETSLEMFRRYWPNPESGVPDVPGVFHSFQIADAEFFLLDGRYHRDPGTAPDRRTLLGTGQLDWLRQRLKASTAVFKVIGLGGTSLSDGVGETWSGYGTERDDLLAWIFREGINGVVFIAGDWHVGVLNRRHRPLDGYPLYELLSSNLAVRMQPVQRDPNWEGPVNNQWISPFIYEYNFGLLTFSGTAGARTVNLQLIDETGATRAEIKLAEADLRSSR